MQSPPKQCVRNREEKKIGPKQKMRQRSRVQPGLCLNLSIIEQCAYDHGLLVYVFRSIQRGVLSMSIAFSSPSGKSSPAR